VESLDDMPDDVLNLIADFQLEKSRNVWDGLIEYKLPVVCWPDPQMRLYKNAPHIRWHRKVHEQLVGFKHYSSLPYEPDYAIIHAKDVERQERQNSFYETL
jgi:hypothetical protein